jgi:hypothetical protein
MRRADEETYDVFECQGLWVRMVTDAGKEVIEEVCESRGLL